MPNQLSRFTYAQLEALWIQAGGDRASAPIMAAIAMAESSGIPTNVNHNNDGTVDRGLWQINSSNVDSPTMFDPMANAKEAVKLKNNASGLRNWVTYTNGAYRKFLQNGVDPSSSGLPTGSTSTATDASLSGDIGGAIGEGFATAFKAVLQPLIATMIWGGEILFGIGMMVVGVIVLVMNTDAGKSAISTAEQDAATIAVPEASAAEKFEMDVQRRHAMAERQRAIRAEVKRRQKSNDDSSTGDSKS